MLIYLDDLRKEDWFSKLPDKFKNLDKNDYFGFYYEYDFDNSVIKVISYDIYTNINIYLYKSLDAEQYLGYFKQPFNTRDTLFYYFLKSYIGDAATDYILSFKAEDNQIVMNEKPQYRFGDFNITDRISYQEALSKFIIKSSLINPLLSLSDTLNSFLQKKHSKSLYGDVIKKIVRLIKFSAEGKVAGSSTDLFIIPEDNGQIRYMMVGENSVLLKGSPELKKAKEMLRLKYSAERIWTETGWYYNPYDGKFRKNIDDIGYGVKEKLTLHTSRNKVIGDFDIWMPDNCQISIEEIADKLVKNPRTDLWSYYIKNGYNGKLGMAFNHPTLFKHYPQLLSLPFYFVKRLDAKPVNVDYSDRRTNFTNYSYRYNPKNNDIVVCGFSKQIESILIHEIQHAIQNIEGFSTGGNQFLASMINNSSGGEVREYMILSEKATDDFCSYISSLSDDEISEKIKNLKEYLKNIWTLLGDQPRIKMTIAYCRYFYDLFLKNTTPITKEELVKNCYSIAIYSIALSKYIEDYNNVSLSYNYQKLLKEFNIQDDISLRKISNTIYQSDKMNENYRLKGFGESDINNILFQTYQNIFGELEARAVQNIANLSTDLREYFIPYTSESLSYRTLTPIITVDESSNIDYKIEAAIEKDNQGKYIIHLTPQSNCVSFIHELGHLVYDIISEYDAIPVIDEIYTSKYITKYKNSDEFFCDYFASYIHRLNINEFLSNDLLKYSDFEVYESLDIILDVIFNVSTNDESLVGYKYLNYVKKLLEYGK